MENNENKSRTTRSTYLFVDFKKSVLERLLFALIFGAYFYIFTVFSFAYTEESTSAGKKLEWAALTVNYLVIFSIGD